jgi:ribosomal protein S18 acetylase RimI-like enzyme
MFDLSLDPVEDGDLPFVRAMLHEAAFWRGLVDAPPVDEALRRRDLARYVDDWGRPGDRGLVARVSGVRAGAVWVRLFRADDHGFGFVDERTPELSIAVAEDHRGCGIGRCLMAAMLAQACLDGVDRVSLSVKADNPALSLHDSLGFAPAGTVGNAVTMVRSVLQRSGSRLPASAANGSHPHRARFSGSASERSVSVLPVV